MHNSSDGVIGSLAAFGALRTCRGVMRAYNLYRYYLFKEKYENYGRQI